MDLFSCGLWGHDAELGDAVVLGSKGSLEAFSVSIREVLRCEVTKEEQSILSIEPVTSSTT